MQVLDDTGHRRLTPLRCAAGAGESSLRFRHLPNLLLLLLLVFFALQIVFVAIMTAGRPLDSWDSWVTWGMKARTIFLDGRISPAVYADPSRAVTHLDYPLLVPLIEAWLFGWLGAPDDRLAGVVSILFYLALLGIGYSAVRRRAATCRLALSVSVVLASIPQVALLRASFMPIYRWPSSRRSPSSTGSNGAQVARRVRCSSLHEAQGMARLEAAACGLPIVGTSVGALADLAPDAAVASPPGDPIRLAQAILSVLDDPARQRMLSESARARVEAVYSLEAAASRFETLYRG